MQRNIKSFEESAKSLIERVAPDLARFPSDAAIKALNERVSETKAAEARSVDAAKRLAGAARASENAKERHSNAQEALRTLVLQLPAEPDPDHFLRRNAEREELKSKIAERREHLVAQADGRDEVGLRSELATFDPDSCEAELKRLALEDERLEQDGREAFAARDRLVRNRTGHEQGVGAEIAFQQRRCAEAELAGAARDWAILKLASLMLSGAVERRRAEKKDPLLARAGELFSMLTGSAFEGIGQDFGDDDTARLVGRRASGDTVSVPGMSDGTRDQLYLALRLAYLEEYARSGKAAPFIGDDLFMTFDDARTEFALAALSAMGTSVQPIIFTHHIHVVEIARAALGDDVDIVNLD